MLRVCLIALLNEIRVGKMNLKKRAGQTAFVLASVLIAAGTTWYFVNKAPAFYDAHLGFQIATSASQPKPNISTEKQLLLSDALLSQTIKDVNLHASANSSTFRSFDLGPQYKANTEHDLTPELQAFRENLSVLDNPQTSTLSIDYKSPDAQEARRIVEVLFEKFKNWRRNENVPRFDEQAMAADKDLAEKREAFLQSQKAFLDYVDVTQHTPASKPDIEARKKELDAKIEALKLRYGPKHPVLIEALRQQQALNISVPAVDDAKLAFLKSKMRADFESLDTAIRQSVILEQQKQKNASSFEILPLGDVEVHAVAAYIIYKTMAAAFLALITALLYLRYHGRFFSVIDNPQDLKKISPFAFLGSVPGLLQPKGGSLSLPAGATADALKTLRQELKMRTGGKEIKLVCVTSTWPQEGRSELVAGIGRLSARSSERVIIIDADLRSPTLQAALPSVSNRNLVDYLSGQSRLEDIIIRTDPSGMHVIYGTAIPNTALDLLSSDKMKTLLTSLREVYDLVLVQAPVSLRGPDARVLANIADHTLYLIEAGKTKKSHIKQGMDVFIDTGIQTVSTILIN